MSSSIHISKLDAAKRELEHALRLFFLSGDPVVIHLVISSSHQILRDLCRSKGLPSFIDDAMKIVKEDKRKYVADKLSSAYNFFHHADRDPDKVIEFRPEANEYALWASIDMYYSLAGEVTGLMQAYRYWFYTKNSHLLMLPQDQKTFKEVAGKIDIGNKRMFLEIATELENKRTYIENGKTE